MHRPKRIITFLLALLMTFAVMSYPILTVAAAATVRENSYNYTLTKNDSFNKDGCYYMSFTLKNTSPSYSFRLTARLRDPSGGLIHEYKGVLVGPGKSMKWDFGYNYANASSGTYKFEIHVVDILAPSQSWYTTYNIKHTAPDPSFSYKSYETYYDKKGYLIHKVNIQCNNMKGERLYCKIYGPDGSLIMDFGSDTPKRKSNKETGYFWWNGYIDGKKCPSGEYTFVITSSANKKVVQQTIKLNILEVSKG